MQSEYQQCDKTRNTRGSLLLEIVIAIGLAAIFFTAIAGLIIIYKKSFQNSFTNQQVQAGVQQGITALESIEFEDLSVIEDGVLIFTDQWSVASGDPEEITPGITRTVSISEVQRDANCNIVSENGDIDPDSYYLSTTIDWQTNNGQNKTLTHQTLKTNWQDPQGSCFAPDPGAGISFNTSEAHWEWWFGIQLRDIYIINDSPDPITITHMALTWSGQLKSGKY